MPFPLLFWKTWLLSSWGLSFPYHHEGSNSLWSVVPAKWRSCQAGVGCPEIWRGSAHLVVNLGVFQEDQKRGMALRGCGTSWTDEGILWGKGHGHQRSAPKELLSWYSLGVGQGLLWGCSEFMRTGPQMPRTPGNLKIPRASLPQDRSTLSTLILCAAPETTMDW